MKKLGIIVVGLVLLSGTVFAQDRMNINEILFGIEYSFQDKEIVQEPGRMTMRTEHKASRLEAMLDAYLEAVGLNRSAITSDTSRGSFKPGYKFNVPGDGAYTINMEPVTVEFNTTPKKLGEIVETSRPIFRAAEEARLVPYVNPAAERSGMGHIHMGAETLGQNPLYKHPQLLRNILVFFHKHPSLLYGFAEAYDIGKNSNIETYHESGRQEPFRQAVEEFDRWFERASQAEKAQGLKKFLELLRKHEPSSRAFTHHYRNINLEHIMQATRLGPEASGKITIEFRGFRPQLGPQHAHANARLLIDVMEAMSKPGHLEPFRTISAAEFKTFWTSAKVSADWAEVKSIIGHENSYSEEMIREYHRALEIQFSRAVEGIPGARMRSAFSQKENKGTAFELTIPVQEGQGEPRVRVGQHQLEFFRAGEVWVAYVDTKSLSIDAEALKDGRLAPSLEGFERAGRSGGLGSRCLGGLRSALN